MGEAVTQLWVDIQQNQYIVPLTIILGSLILGYIFQKIVIGQAKRITRGTRWEGDDIIVNGVDTAPVLWFLLVGIYAAMVDFPITMEYRDITWKIVLIVFILSIAAVSSRVAVGFIKSYSSKHEQAVGSTSMFGMLTRVTIFTLAILVILQTFGLSITPLLTALGVGGLAVALALQETLSNLFAGLHIIASKKLKPGDFIELDSGQSGRVTDISWRNTLLKTLGNNLIIVPNVKVASAIITNYAGPEREMSLIIPIGVSYDSELEHVEKVIIEVATKSLKKVEGAVPDYEPKVRYNQFADSSIKMSVILRVQDFTNQYVLQHEFIKALHKRFQKEKIEIPFPQRDIFIKNQS